MRDTLKLLQPVSETPLLLRQIPLRRDGIVVGAIDLALERAYVWREHAESEVTEIPGDEKAREVEARFSMLETLADHDDHLMEQLLEEVAPPQDDVFDDLAADLRDGSVTPVLIGTAEKGNGVLRLLKTIRHDVADVEATRKRLGVTESAGTVAQVMKTVHTAHGGKLSVSRILSGTVNDGSELTLPGGGTARVSGIYRLLGKDQIKLTSAKAGDTVALGKLEGAKTGNTLGSGKASAKQLFDGRAGATGVLDRASPQRAQGRGKNVSGDPASCRGRPVTDHRSPGYRRNHPVGSWRDASAGDRRAA